MKIKNKILISVPLIFSSFLTSASGMMIDNHFNQKTNDKNQEDKIVMSKTNTHVSASEKQIAISWSYQNQTKNISDQTFRVSWTITYLGSTHKLCDKSTNDPDFKGDKKGAQVIYNADDEAWFKKNKAYEVTVYAYNKNSYSYLIFGGEGQERLETSGKTEPLYETDSFNIIDNSVTNKGFDVEANFKTGDSYGAIDFSKLMITYNRESNKPNVLVTSTPLLIKRLDKETEQVVFHFSDLNPNFNYTHFAINNSVSVDETLNSNPKDEWNQSIWTSVDGSVTTDVYGLEEFKIMEDSVANHSFEFQLDISSNSEAEEFKFENLILKADNQQLEIEEVSTFNKNDSNQSLTGKAINLSSFKEYANFELSLNDGKTFITIDSEIKVTTSGEISYINDSFEIDETSITTSSFDFNFKVDFINSSINKLSLSFDEVLLKATTSSGIKDLTLINGKYNLFQDSALVTITVTALEADVEYTNFELSIDNGISFVTIDPEIKVTTLKEVFYKENSFKVDKTSIAIDSFKFGFKAILNTTSINKINKLSSRSFDDVILNANTPAGEKKLTLVDGDYKIFNQEFLVVMSAVDLESNTRYTDFKLSLDKGKTFTNISNVSIKTTEEDEFPSAYIGYILFFILLIFLVILIIFFIIHNKKQKNSFKIVNYDKN